MSTALNQTFHDVHDRVHLWHSDAGECDFDAGVGEDRVEQRWVFAVAVADQVAGSASSVVQVHGEVTRSLVHPGGGRVGGHAEDSNAASCVLDHGEDVHPCAGEGYGFHEVDGEDRLSL